MKHPKVGILIVDDSETQRQFLSYLLRHEHYEVYEAKDGKQGLMLANEKKPDLIITDILMPEIDGYEMVRRIKEEHQLDAQVIFYTGNYQEAEAKHLADSFGSYYIKKPANKRELLNLIKETLEKKTSKKLSEKELREISKKHLDLITNKLYQRVIELEKLNLELERRITARTRELEIANKRLHEESLRDPLTGVFNRRYLKEILVRELAIAKRHKRHFWVVMMDIDRFKLVNDKYGHHEGDVVLYRFAQCLKKTIRKEDIVCRYGGDEFVLIFPEIEQENLLHLLNIIQIEIAHLEMASIKSKADITLSMGAVESSEDFSTIDEMMEAADVSLYQAKLSGRNRIIIYQPKNPRAQLENKESE